MTVTTVFSGTADGYIDSGQLNATYANAREGTSASEAADTASTTVTIGQRVVASNWSAYEAFLLFDTSAIPDGDQVTVVTLDLWLVTDTSTTDFTLEVREFDWGGSLTVTDFVPGSSLAAQTLMASISTSGIGATGAYKTLASQAAFLTATNLKTGTVNLMASSSEQRLNSATTGYTDWSSANNAGTTQDPKLTVTHLPPAMPPFPPIPVRVWSVF